MSLDELVAQTALSKGVISTHVRGLARLGLIHPASHLGDRKDYYRAETDFYRAVRAILNARRNSDFDRAVATAQHTLKKTGVSRFLRFGAGLLGRTHPCVE
ncbi:MAG: hypothetical protein ABSB41_04615 [Anaerolineales bacterium]